MSSELCNIWITRSEPGASRLARHLRGQGFVPEQGFKVLVEPVVAIRQLNPPKVSRDGSYLDCESVQTELRQRPDLVVVCSVHAIEGYVALASINTEVLHLAIGPQTAHMLEKHEIIARLPEVATSEGLLTMPQVHQLARGSRVWLIAGMGGRDHIERNLVDEIGCKVTKLEFYQRLNLATSLPLKDSVGAIVVSSENGLERAFSAWSAQKGSNDVLVIVPSARVGAAAVSKGLSNIVDASGAGPEAVANVLAEQREKLIARQDEKQA